MQRARNAIIHIDMDAFYASVEQRDNPQLKGKPVIVGGHPTRGVVLAASYEVRPFGVRSAMPMARALRLAPQAVVVAPRFSAYAQASDQLFRILESVSPLVEPLSLDEAFLDVSASLSLFGTPNAIATRLRSTIRKELELAASAGIAEVKFVAKIASDWAKPDGLYEVLPGQAKAFLAPLPVSRLWGVGAKTEEHLKSLGLKTIADIAAISVEEMERRLGNSGRHLWELSQGIDERAVIPDREAKSIGAQDTFDEDVSDLETLQQQIHAQSLRVARRLRRAQVKGHVVQLTLKFSDFKLITRRRTLAAPTDDGQLLYREACALLAQVDMRRSIRLTGVAAHELTQPEEQLGLFQPAPSRSDKLNRALDAISQKFGNGAITTGDLASEPSEDAASEDIRRQMGASRVKKPQ